MKNVTGICKGIKVLSLFDGMSCGRIAFDRAGIKVNKYYASEIDKYAEKVSKDNYQEIIRLGDITAWHFWNIERPDIIIAGSPCQGFSFAGKQLNFEDPRSKLFFQFVEILKYYKPKYFLLENVKMKKEYQDIISGLLGVKPIEINSALISAQNRKRLYWTNIPNIKQPEDKGILLKDILETGIVDRDKSHCLDANYFKVASYEQYKKKSRRQLVGCIQVGTAGIKGHDCINRVYSTDGKSPTLTAVCGGHQEKKISLDNITWRKLTPLECERLQTVPDNYTKHVSKSQRYKMLGNGWTVDVIVHIFKSLSEVS